MTVGREPAVNGRVTSFHGSRLGSALVLVFACSFDSSGSGGGSGDAGSTDGSGSASMSATVGDSSTAASLDGSASASASTTAGTTAGTTASTTDGTTAATDEGSSSMSGASTSDGGSTAGEGAGSSSTGGQPATYHLQHGDQTACDDPLWCYFNGNVLSPAGDPIEGQECFTAPISPPFELLSMHYSVAAVHTDLEDFELRVYERDGGGPSNLIEQVTLTQLDASPMEHDYEFAAPIQIDTQEFCIGFATTAPGLASALGMAVDTDSTVGDASFFRMEGNGACNVPDWEDVVSFQPNPFGNWCMDAEIREIP